METLESESVLWTDLGERAVQAPSGKFKKEIFPIKFKAREWGEILRDLVVSGILPLTAYLVYLSVLGLNLAPSTGIVSLLLFLPLSLGLAWLLSPLFHFTDLKRWRDIVPLFAVGILLPLIFALAEASLRPTPALASFGTQVAKVFTYFSVPTTVLPLFAFSVLGAWGLKWLTRRVLQATPWFDQPKVSPLRKSFGVILLLSPFAFFLLSAYSALPSEGVKQWEQRVRLNPPPFNPWLPHFANEHAESWQNLRARTLNEHVYDVNKQPGAALSRYEAGALELLREGSLPHRSYYDTRYLIEDILKARSGLKDGPELATWTIAAGLTLGKSPERNEGFRYLIDRVERNAFALEELESLQERLDDLLQSMPKGETILNHTLVSLLTEKNEPLPILWLTEFLSRKRLSPIDIARRRWLNSCVESWLALELEVAGSESLDDLAKEKDRKPKTQELYQDLDAKTRFLSLHPEGTPSFLGLRNEYEKNLHFLLLGVKLRIHQKSKGELPNKLPFGQEFEEQFGPLQLIRSKHREDLELIGPDNLRLWFRP